MNDHQLHNVRRGPNTVPDDTAEPCCSQCGIALHLVPLEGIRTGTRTHCSDACYQTYINESAWQKVRDHVASPAYQAQWHAEQVRNPPPKPKPLTAYQLEQQQIVDFHRRQAAKSNVRKTAEVGANIIGFCLWLVVISLIASVLAMVL